MSVSRAKTIQSTGRAQALREQLAAMARRLGPGGKLPRVTDLCHELGVSPTTLNRVLGEMASDGTLERRHAVGIFVREDTPARVRHLLMICHPTFFQSATQSPFWAMLVDGIRERVRSAGSLLDVHFARDDDSLSPFLGSVRQEIENGQVDGVIGIGLYPDSVQWLQSHVPFVSFGGEATYFVGDNPESLIYLAVDALVAQGCERIGFWQSVAPFRREYNYVTNCENHLLSVLEEALKFRGREFHRCLTKTNTHLLSGPDDSTTETQQEQGFRTAMEVFGGDKQSSTRNGGHPEKRLEMQPDGIVICEDLMTRGALAALAQLGKVPGRDVFIATHANQGSNVLHRAEKGLSLIEFDPREIVDLLLGSLEHLMAGEKILPGMMRPTPRLKHF